MFINWLFCSMTMLAESAGAKKLEREGTLGESKSRSEERG